MGEFLRHMRAGDVNETWLGYRFTATNRATGEQVTGGLSDVQQYRTQPAETRLFMGGAVVELRADDTVSAGTLQVPGGAL